jgi:Fic family protein
MTTRKCVEHHRTCRRQPSRLCSCKPSCSAPDGPLRQPGSPIDTITWVLTLPSCPTNSTAEKGRLAELTCDILTVSGRLSGPIHSPHVVKAVADLVREMNSYYSNLIEGHKTTPREIERALQQDFSSNQTQRENQQLGLARLAVEQSMEGRVSDDAAMDAYAPDFLCWIHIKP